MVYVVAATPAPLSSLCSTNPARCDAAAARSEIVKRTDTITEYHRQSVGRDFSRRHRAHAGDAESLPAACSHAVSPAADTPPFPRFAAMAPIRA